MLLHNSSSYHSLPALLSGLHGSLGALERHRTEEGVDFAAYLDEMAPVWRRRHSSRAAELVIEVEPLLAPDTAASTLAMITQELIGNALSHGYEDNRSGRILVRLTKLPEGRCELVVTDDGQGFDPAAPRSGRGLANQARRASAIKAKLTVESGPEGTRLTLLLPIEQRAEGMAAVG